MPVSPLKKAAVGLGAFAAAATFAACGSEDSSASASDEFLDQSGLEIAKDAVAAMKDVTSLRVKGDVTDEGKDLSLDFTIDETSGNCSGSFSQDGLSAELISLGEEQYMKADTSFWEAMAGEGDPKELANMFGGKWVKVPTSSEDFGELCDLDELLEGFDEAPEKGEKITKGDVETVDGREAVVLTGEEDGEKTRVWVAVDGDHHIVKIEATDGDEPGTLELLDINETPEITAPPKDEILDLTS